MRSVLITPPDATSFARALSSGADAVVLDLAASANPTATWTSLMAELRDGPSAPLLFAGVALEDEGLGMLLSAVTAVRAGVALLRARTGQCVTELDARLGVAEAESGAEDGTTAILAVGGTSAADALALPSFATASPRLKALGWDAQALAASINCRLVRPLPAPLQSARTAALLAARAAAALALDTAPPAGTDASTLRRDCEEARDQGFSGKLVRDPDHAAIVNAVFA